MDAIKNVKDKVESVKVSDLTSWSDVLTAISEHNVESIYHLGSAFSSLVGGYGQVVG